MDNVNHVQISKDVQRVHKQVKHARNVIMDFIYQQVHVIHVQVIVKNVQIQVHVQNVKKDFIQKMDNVNHVQILKDVQHVHKQIKYVQDVIMDFIYQMVYVMNVQNLQIVSVA